MGLVGMRVEDRLGRPLEDVVETWAELWPLQLDLADEARALLLTAESGEL